MPNLPIEIKSIKKTNGQNLNKIHKGPNILFFLMLFSIRFALVLGLIPLLMGMPAYTSEARDSLTIGITQFASTQHPSLDPSAAKAYIHGFTRRPITYFDAQWKLQCWLCTRLPTLENGQAVPVTLADGKQGVRLTYQLDPQARWGDGTPITTKDVRFTWEVGRHPKSGFANSELYQRITKIDSIDDKVFVLHSNKLDFQYNAINDFRLLPAHLEQTVFAEPEQYRLRTLFDTKPTHPGLGFGPYRIVELSSGSHITLELNPHWWRRKPHFKRIIVRTIENTAALEANLLSGSIDMVAGELGMPIDQALAFEKRHGDAYNLIYKAGLIYEHIDLRLDTPILSDRRVRQALLYALDRQQITAKLFGGYQTVAVTNVSPLDWVFTDHVPTYPYDPKRAAALLDEAGWIQKNGHTVRQNAKGEILQLELMTTAGNQSRELVQQILQAQWKILGIQVRIRNQPARVLFGETVTQRRFPSMVMYAWISSPESVPRTTLHSSMIPTQENGWAGQNYAGVQDKRFDRLIDKIELELDRDKRQSLWHQLQKLYAEELPVLPLYYRADSHILPLWLTGVTPTGHQVPTTMSVEDWGLKK